MGEPVSRIVYRPGPQRRGGFAAVYHELLDLYMPHIGGFLGVGYYTLLLRLVSRRPGDPYADRAYPTKRYLKHAGGIGADKLKELELRLVAWGLLEIQIETIPVRGRGGNLTQALKYTYYVNDPLPPEAFEEAVREGRLPRPIPPGLLPSWWSPAVAQRLGIPYSAQAPFPVPEEEQGTPFPVPGQEQGNTVAVPGQEQGTEAPAVPGQEQRIPCSQSGTKKNKKTLTLKNNVVVAQETPVQQRSSRRTPSRRDDDDVYTLCKAYEAVTRQPIPPEQARQLLARYGLVDCLRQLRTLAWRLDRGSLERPLAYYLKALEGRYEPGPVRRHRQAKRRAQLEILKARREAAAATEAVHAKRIQAQRAEALLAVLPEAERQALEEEARRRLASRVGTVLSEAMVRMEMRMLALRRYGPELAGSDG